MEQIGVLLYHYPPVLSSAWLLKKGDELSMRVVEDKEPPVELMVTDSGEVEVPLIGRVRN